ncbi:MAG TPA: nuclear transport factor 2 family protein [Verrucomicrobiae bacterium]|nr:nuclear transport factor 2 family protein [Verrucomicrobiae bacterium]
MKRIGAIALTVALFYCAAGLLFARSGKSSATSQSAAQQAVTQLEQKWLQNEDDPATLNSILADDFVHVLPSGFISKQQHIAFVQAHPQQKLLKRHFEQLRVRVYGNVAIANGIVAELPAKAAKDGAALKMLFTDVFVFRNGRWQAVNAQETPMVQKK